VQGTCDEVSGRLVGLPGEPDAAEAPTVLVGPWAELRGDEDARSLERGPQTSGVFANFERSGGGWELVALDETLAEEERMGDGAGLVAALDDGRGEPTWLVTGTDAIGVATAAESLDASILEDRFAVATPTDSDPVPLPVP
jgi:hypothetical protein